MNFSVGPFFRPNGLSGLAAPRLRHAGFTLEYASSDQKVEIPIFVRDTAVPRYRDLYIFRCDVPWDFDYFPRHTCPDPDTLASFEGLLASFASQQRTTRNFLEVLEDFREAFDFAPAAGWARDHVGRGYLHDDLEDCGFRLNPVESPDRTVRFPLYWISKHDAESEWPNFTVLVGGMSFRPRAGALGNGTWWEPDATQCGRILHDAFRLVAAAKYPTQALSEAGRERLLNAYEWSPLARITAKQAREDRVEFIRAHNLLEKEPLAIAEALRQANLYSPSMSNRQIARFLPSLLAEARMITGAKTDTSS